MPKCIFAVTGARGKPQLQRQLVKTEVPFHLEVPPYPDAVGDKEITERK